MLQTPNALRWAWVGLVSITVLSLVVAEFTGISSGVETAVVIAAAATKGRIILVRYMGERSFPVWLRLYFGGWLIVCASVIIGFHFS
jgi:hypothetical protein